MSPRNNKGRGFSKKLTKTEELTFISGIPGLGYFHFNCGRHNSAAKFKESLLELTNHVVRNIDYGGENLASSIKISRCL